MQKIKAYSYAREDGGMVDTIYKPVDKNFTEQYLLIADAGKILSKDGQLYISIYADSDKDWVEIDRPEEPEENFE